MSNVLRLQVLQYLLILGFSLTLASCLDQGPCTTPFEKTISVHVDRDGNELSLNVRELEFLSDPNLVIDDVDLNLKVKGKRKKSKEEDIELSLNGVKVVRRDGGKHCDSMKSDDDEREHSRGHFKLHKFFLNGGESFEHFLMKLKKNKGLLKIKLRGKNVFVLSATVTFKGKIKTKCVPGPSVTPSPTPVSVVTTISSVSPNQSPTSSTSISISFSSNVQNVQSFCSLDNQAFSPCSSPKSYSNLVNGSHKFSIYSQDSLGNKDQIPASYSWIVDSVAPSVSIANAAQLPTLTNSNSIQFDLVSSESSSFMCSLDGAAAVACLSPKSYSALLEGAHSFAVTAVDSVGNISDNAATFNWTVDVTAPITTIVSVAPAEIIGNSANKVFGFSANESSTFECSIDHQAFVSCVSPFTVANIGEGSHSVDIRATDAAGNLGLAASYSWRVDLTAPILSLGTVSPAAGASNAHNVSVEFSANEAVNSFCSFDNSGFAACQSPYSNQNLLEGAHQLQIYGVDLAGNQSQTLSLNWNLDFTSPTISFGQILPSSSANVNSSQLSFEIIGASNSNLVVNLNGVLVPQTQSPIQLSNLGEGSYFLSVSAIDSVGNVSPAIIHNFNVDLTAPVVTLQASNLQSPTQADSNTMSFASSESAPFECQFDGAGFSACISPLNLAGLADGNHLFEVRAIDAAGNVSEVRSYSWVIDTTAPTTSIVGTQTAANAVSASLSSNENNVHFECKLDDSPAAACSSPLNLSGLSVGLHFLIVNAIDAAGNRDSVGASYLFTVAPPIQTILVSVSPSNSPTNIVTEVFEFTASEANASFVCSIDDAPLTACQSPYSYSSSSDGSHIFRVFAVDQYGFQDPSGVSYSWSIDLAAPVVTSISFTMTTNSITVNWTTNEATTTQILYGIGFTINQSTTESTALSTSHSVTVAGLSANSTYSVTVAGHDIAGNAYSSGPRTVKTNR